MHLCDVDEITQIHLSSERKRDREGEIYWKPVYAIDVQFNYHELIKSYT